MNFRVIILVILGVFIGAGAASAGELAEDLDISGTIDFSSAYIWRAQTLVDGPVLQPAANITYKGFAFDFWSNWDLAEDEEFTEIDYTWSYSTSLGFVIPDEDLLDKIDVTGGYTFYTFPNLDDDDITNEIYFGISLDTLLQPSYTAYWDFDQGDGWYHEWGIGHSFDLEPITVDAGISLGLNVEQWGYDTSLTALNFATSATIPLDKIFNIEYLKYITVAPHISYSLRLDTQYENEVYGGVAATVAF
ncbi:MAG: hypothetical protein ABH875_05695 [Candidatus Omnitrophota bacterium]